MTAVETSLADRLTREDPFVGTSLGKAHLNLIIAGAAIKNKTTQHDFLLAVENYIDSFGVTEDMPSGYKDAPRPDSDDTRPLYLRINDEAQNIGNSIRSTLSGLQLLVVLIQDSDARKGYASSFAELNRSLGLPTVSEHKANPDAYPGVGEKTALDDLGEIFRSELAS